MTVHIYIGQREPGQESRGHLIQAFKEGEGEVVGLGGLGDDGGGQLLGVTHHHDPGFRGQQLEGYLHRRLQGLGCLHSQQPTERTSEDRLGPLSDGFVRQPKCRYPAR